jgi:hypothetical protein
VNNYKVTWYALGAAQVVNIQAADFIYDRDTLVLIDQNKKGVLAIPMELTPVVQLVTA